MRRDNTPVIEPEHPPQPHPQASQTNTENGPAEVMPPLPDSRQPGAAAMPVQPQKPGATLPPMPGQSQTPAATQPTQPAANPGDVLPPLPESQQPPAAKQPNSSPPPK
jgi:hypothetical protein